MCTDTAPAGPHLSKEEYRKLDELCSKIFRKAHANSIEEVTEAANPLLESKGDQDYREQVLMNLIIKYSSHPFTHSELKRMIQTFFAKKKTEKSPD